LSASDYGADGSISGALLQSHDVLDQILALRSCGVGVTSLSLLADLFAPVFDAAHQPSLRLSAGRFKAPLSDRNGFFLEQTSQ
jgi:hypothetical protein